MPVRRGSSQAASPHAAVGELKSQLEQEGLALVLFFASPAYAREALAAELNSAFSGCLVLGCTTAGEITPAGYQEGTLTALSFSGPEFRVSHVLIPSLADFGVEAGKAVVQQALHDLDLAAPSARHSPSQTFAMLMIDGLSHQEEMVVSSLNRFLDPIPLFGGSAGDGLDFQATYVFANGAFHANAAILAVIQTSRPFRVFKLDHFSPTGTKVVVTEADPNQRLVSEINAEPAAPAYARLVGIDENELSPHVFAAHPVVVRVGGEYHVRSIQKVEPDGSLRFYCGIDEGLVLTMAEGGDMAAKLEEALAALEQDLGQVDTILGFDCILRRLEAEQSQKARDVSDILKRHKVVGFSTYGEQFRSMHVNQTFTGVAIGGPARAEKAP
jgi:hypothetical protein